MVQKIRQFFKRYLSINTVVLWAINKMLPSQWGRVESIAIERESKDVSLTLQDGELATELTLYGYKIEMEGEGKARLHWRKVSVNGHNQSAIQRYFANRLSTLIPVPSRFVMLVALLDRDKLNAV